MTNQQAAQILRDHNEWRRDRSEDSLKAMPTSYNPALLGQAIDTAIAALDQPKQTELERFKADLLRLFSFSDGVNWMTVDSDGDVCQFTYKPESGISYWSSDNGQHNHIGIVKIPENVNWRDCLIERT